MREGKGDRHLLCEAPEGPFRQKVPVTFCSESHMVILMDVACLVLRGGRR